MMANSQQHPEEIECFRTPGEGRFSPDKCYEYTYATRKSWEYIPELGRQDWRYFTNKGFTYAGKWLRNDRNGWRDSGDCWEVFRSNGDGNGHGETIVYWDYAATLCWRECRCYDDDDNEVRTVTRTIMDEMITAIEENVSIVPTVGESDGGGGEKAPAPNSNWSLFECIFGLPCKTGLLDNAEITTMECKYRVHANIAEFWCFITSFFYGSSLLLYIVKEEDWFDEWRAAAGWPGYIHFSIGISVIVMICSSVYHACIIELAGRIDCFFASFMCASATMTVFGVDIITQIGVLLLFGVIHLNARRYITRFAMIIMTFVFPFSLLSYTRMKSYYGGILLTMVLTGVACFMLDRMGVAPLHSVWHVLSGTAVAITLYYTVVNGMVGW
ncbi:MAG: hypothetical protein EBU66_08685 [Bacteroidetes bacterium]|nr:hypothetical protein [Bacteroidota bacterium]